MSRGNSDQAFVNPPTMATKYPSPGLQSSLMCWGCETPKSALGGRLLGKLKLWHCVACVEARVAAGR